MYSPLGQRLGGGRVCIVAKSFLMLGVIKALLVVLRCGWSICGRVTLLVSAELFRSSSGAAAVRHLLRLRLCAAKLLMVFFFLFFFFFVGLGTDCTSAVAMEIAPSVHTLKQNANLAPLLSFNETLECV